MVHQACLHDGMASSSCQLLGDKQVDGGEGMPCPWQVRPALPMPGMQCEAKPHQDGEWGQG